MSTVSNGWNWLVRGLPAFEVLTIAISFPCLASQVQPEPKLSWAWLVKSSRNLSTDPHLATIACLS